MLVSDPLTNSYLYPIRFQPYRQPLISSRICSSVVATLGFHGSGVPAVPGLRREGETGVKSAGVGKRLIK